MSDCQCHQRGSIHLIIGPMFSGKTTELFRLAQRHTLAGRKVVVVKYAHDTRYDATHACTHDRRKMEALSATAMAGVYEECTKFDVIGIDEGQFFKDVVQYAQNLADLGKTVIIAALNGDYRQQPFQNVVTLIPMAEKIEKLSAVCRCGQSASFTFRMSDCTKLEMIGGEELYRALCRACVNNYRHMKEHLMELKNGGFNNGGGTRNLGGTTKRAMPDSDRDDATMMAAMQPPAKKFVPALKERSGNEQRLAASTANECSA